MVLGKSPKVVFEHDLFVNREHERKIFLDAVRKISEPECLQFIGIAGQGKSELLKWIFHTALKENYLCAYADLESAQYHREDIFPILDTISTHLPGDIFKPFEEKISAFMAQVSDAREVSSQAGKTDGPTTPEEWEDSLIKAFNTALSVLLKKQKVVICLDSTDKASAQTLRQFEDRVILSFSEQAGLMIVTAGREEFAWKSNWLKNQTKRFKLSRLTLADLKQQMECLSKRNQITLEDIDQIPHEIAQLTLGHPFSSYKLIDFWTGGFQHPINKITIKDHFALGVQVLTKQVIEDRILENLQLGKTYPPVKEILSCLASLRRIELGTIYFLLSSFLGEYFEGKPIKFFQRLMNSLQEKYIIEKWKLGNGYDMDIVVRNILLWDMRTNEPDRFIEIQQVLAKQYSEWAAETRDDIQIMNIMERLYYRAICLSITRPEDTERKICEELKVSLNSYFTNKYTGSTEKTQAQLVRLKNALEDDAKLADMVSIHMLSDMIKSAMI